MRVPPSRYSNAAITEIEITLMFMGRERTIFQPRLMLPPASQMHEVFGSEPGAENQFPTQPGCCQHTRALLRKSTVISLPVSKP